MKGICIADYHPNLKENEEFEYRSFTAEERMARSLEIGHNAVKIIYRKPRYGGVDYIFKHDFKNITEDFEF